MLQRALTIAATLFAGATLPAVAQAVTYTTTETVQYDPSQPNYTGNGFQSASNNSSYVVRTGIDNTNFYVDVTSTPNPATDLTQQYANIYVGGSRLSPGLIFEVTNNRVSTTSAPSKYYSLAGTGFTFTQATNDISFVLPLSFIENDPLGIGFVTEKPGDTVRVSYAQAFGLSLVFGGYVDPVNRLGTQTIPAAPAAAVPEPAAWALMIAGLGAIGMTLRRRARRSDAAFDLRIRRIAAGEIA